jgi:putative aldouronate transport system permease protein
VAIAAARIGRRLNWRRGERLWDAGVWAILALVTLASIVPLWYVVMISLTPASAWSATHGSLLPLPNQLSLGAYEQMLGNGLLQHAFGVSVYITVVGTLLNVTATALLAYPLSLKRFKLRRPILLLVLGTALFNGGLVPTYLLVRSLGLYGTYWSLMIPGLVTAFNLLIMKAFFQNLPDEILDAARIDGASEFQILWRIVLPLSKPILATVALFYAVEHWNSFFTAILYIPDANMQPLQVVLRSILTSFGTSEFTDQSLRNLPRPEALQMAAVVLATIPILVVYPFLQRYFTAGVLLGSVKE